MIERKVPGGVVIRSNVVFDRNRFDLIPGEVLRQLQYMPPPSQQQHDEGMYYERCCYCKRTIAQIKLDGCTDPRCGDSAPSPQSVATLKREYEQCVLTARDQERWENARILESRMRFDLAVASTTSNGELAAVAGDVHDAPTGLSANVASVDHTNDSREAQATSTEATAPPYVPSADDDALAAATAGVAVVSVVRGGPVDLPFRCRERPRNGSSLLSRWWLWSHERCMHTSAAPDRIWSRWTVVACWANDDPDIARARLQGPLAVGASGWVKPRRRPRLKFAITRVVPAIQFDYAFRLPGAVLHFEHDLQSTATGCRFTHRVRFTGPLAKAWGALVGGAIVAGLPGVMANIAANAQEQA